MSNLYRTLTKTDILTQQLGGYKAELRFCPVEDFTLINQPATPTVIGDAISKDDAMKMKQALEEAGAKVKLS